MRTVDVGELDEQLSGYLQYVRNGEEVVIRDHNIPVARILPILQADQAAQESQPIEPCALKLPEQEMDWEAFFARKLRGNVPHDVAVQAVIDSRGDR